MSEKIKVFLDDDFEAKKRIELSQGYDKWVSTPEEVIELLRQGIVSHISLDHDLGLEPDPPRNGRMVTKWIEEEAFYGRIRRVEWRLHTANSIGYKQMSSDMENAEKFWLYINDNGRPFSEK